MAMKELSRTAQTGEDSEEAESESGYAVLYRPQRLVKTMASGNDDITVVYKLRDLKPQMVSAWAKYFAEYPQQRIQFSHGDIFEEAPYADAIVSPANSFGFMDGGIDMVYSQHFGWQMQKRLQREIREACSGEILVGDAVIIPAYDADDEERDEEKLSRCNDGKPIKYLISAPTMRVPMTISNTVNSYLAFRAVILAVKKHNADPSCEPIRSVLCPGLGTAVGKMPCDRCAQQMLQTFRVYELGEMLDQREPDGLNKVWENHIFLSEHVGNKDDGE